MAFDKETQELCFKNFKSNDLGINHTKVSITDVGDPISESGLSTTALEYVTNFRDLWTLMAFKSQTQQQYCFQSSFNSGIVNCTLYIKLNVKGISALCKDYLKSSQCQVETPHKEPDIQPTKWTFFEFCWISCAFTYMHKTIVEIHLQEMRNNDLVGLVLSLHHLFYHRLSCRAFPVTKKITRTLLNLSMWVSVGSSPIVMSYVFRILEL